MKSKYVILPFEYMTASEADYEKFLVYSNRMRAERVPEDPPQQLRSLMGDYKNIPDFVVVRMFAAWTEDMSEIVGVSEGNILVNMDGNAHLFEYSIGVLAEHRQQGLGTRLLEPMVAFAQETGRTLMITWSDSKVPAGDIALAKIGAEIGMESHTNRLVLKDLDRDLMSKWLEEGPRRAEGFTLGLWETNIPDADLDQYVMICRVMNTAPKGSLQIDDFNMTAEQLRQEEVNMAASGTMRWTMYIRHNESGNIVGFTEVYYDPQRASRLGQGATGVLPEYRNHGLGRWLKAAMMEKILRERPDVLYVYTGNANTNAPMLKINHLMGFKPYKENRTWQVPVEKVAAYLQGKNSQQAIMEEHEKVGELAV